jgi:hypothetical protein
MDNVVDSPCRHAQCLGECIRDHERLKKILPEGAALQRSFATGGFD